ncbi:1-(5-phosphoribosyl)-5-[(5-phosphoribosylamino)methylideneamino]imidazole-4-carboxamide isomerase [soil metagenome]
MSLTLYPAIDIRGGSAVRLMQGDYDRETAYDADPLDAATRWVEGGASWLHIVDLDGARSGASANLEHVRRICAGLDVSVQFGGGLRGGDAVAAALNAGVERVVIGTAALRDLPFLDAMLAEHGERVVVGVDARGGKAALEGWVETSDEPAAALITALSKRGAQRFVFTPIEVDGTMEGPPMQQLASVCEGLEGELIYSGGVGTVEHLRTLAAEAPDAVGGAIVGRALYEGRFTVAEALEALAPA